MHQYKIIATYYSEAGALTNNYEYRYADTPEQAKEIYNDYNKQKYESVDEEGNVVIGGKKIQSTVICISKKRNCRCKCILCTV